MIVKYIMIMMLSMITLLACGADSTTGPTPISTELEVKLNFVMMKSAWYDCGIAVQGDHSRAIKIYVNQRLMGSIIGAEPHQTRRLDLIVSPGRYDWYAVGENYKHVRLRWSGTALANYPMGATLMLGCE